jgi:hypothetical protein
VIVVVALIAQAAGASTFDGAQPCCWRAPSGTEAAELRPATTDAVVASARVAMRQRRAR